MNHTLSVSRHTHKKIAGHDLISACAETWREHRVPGYAYPVPGYQGTWVQLVMTHTTELLCIYGTRVFIHSVPGTSTTGFQYALETLIAVLIIRFVYIHSRVPGYPGTRQRCPLLYNVLAMRFVENV